MDINDNKIELAKMAVEFWRVLKVFDKHLTNYPPDNKTASVVRNAERKLLSILEESNLKLVIYDGQIYSPNLAVTIVNNDDFSENENLIVGNTLEPTILCDGRLLHIGKAILIKKEG